MAIHEYQQKLYLRMAVIAAIVTLPIAGFFVGVQYQKSNAKNTNQLSASGGPGGGQFPGANGGQRPNIGTVTAVSDSSITMTSRFDNSSKTFNFSSSTKVTENQTSASTGDIKVGDTAVIITDSSSSTDASQIILNPTMSGGGAPGLQ